MLPCYSPLFRIVLVIFVFLTSALFLYIFLCPLSFLSSFLSGFLNLLFSFRNPLSEHLPFTRFLDVLKPYENQLNIARASVLFLVSFLWKCSSPSPSPLSRCLSLSSSRVFNSSNSTVSSCVLIWQNLAGDDPPSVRPQWFHVTSKNQSNSLSAQTVSMNRLYFDDPLSVLPACLIVHLSAYLRSFLLSFLAVTLFVCLSVCLSVVCLSIYLSAYLFSSFPSLLLVCLSVCLSACLSVFLSVICPHSFLPCCLYPCLCRVCQSQSEWLSSFRLATKCVICSPTDTNTLSFFPHPFRLLWRPLASHLKAYRPSLPSWSVSACQTDRLSLFLSFSQVVCVFVVCGLSFCLCLCVISVGSRVHQVWFSGCQDLRRHSCCCSCCMAQQVTLVTLCSIVAQPLTSRYIWFFVSCHAFFSSHTHVTHSTPYLMCHILLLMLFSE